MRDNRCISHPCLKHAAPSLCPVRDRRSSGLGWAPRGSVLSTSGLGQAPLPVRLPALEPACFFSQDRRTRSIGCYTVVTDARKELGGILFSVTQRAWLWRQRPMVSTPVTNLGFCERELDWQLEKDPLSLSLSSPHTDLFQAVTHSLGKRNHLSLASSLRALEWRDLLGTASSEVTGSAGRPGFGLCWDIHTQLWPSLFPAGLWHQRQDSWGLLSHYWQE